MLAHYSDCNNSIDSADSTGSTGAADLPITLQYIVVA